MAKGYFGRRKNVWTVAKNAVEKGLTYAYRDRKQKKRNVRSVWIVRINAAVREYGMSYSEFIGKCNATNITLSRKALADLALNHPEAFKAIINEVKDATPVSRPDNAPKAKTTAAPEAKVAAPKKAAAKKSAPAEEVAVEEVAVEVVAETPAEDAPVKKARATKAKKEEETKDAE